MCSSDLRVLAPSGIVAPSPQFGKPNPVWSNLQTLKMVGAAATRWGLPMVAYRIRRLMTFGITPPVFGSVHPQLWKRYVDLTNRGIAPVGPGVPSLRVWRIEFGPSAITAPMPQFGVQAVRNKTPELHPFGYPQTLWGSTQIHNQWTRYAFQGFKSDSFGATQVSYRTRIVAPPGASTLYVSPLLQVFNNTPNPPPMQRALPASIPYGGIGSVSLWQPIITPGGVAPGSLGAPGVVSMGIGPQGISPPFDKSTGVQFGIPFIPGYQVVIPPAIPPDRSDQTPAETFGTASFGPFYVWAPHGYPYDAGIGERGELMDNRFIGQNNPARPFWGNATVTNQNRVVGVINYGGDASFGTAFVTQRPRWLRSTGSKLQKFGYPVLNGGGGAQCYGFDMSLIGLVDVAHAPYRGPQTVLPVGIGATGWGDAWVANWIRNLYPSGWEEFEVSPPAPPSWPRVSTWVSIAYPPFPAAGTVMSLYGTPWVSFRIRSLDPSGWVDESFGFTPGYFSDRMRVRERHIVKAKGWMSAACGAPRISNRLTVAAPRGAAPGGFGLVNVRKQKRVNVPGTQMGIFGDVQRWIADTIQVQGQDLSALGKAVLRSVIDAHGFAGAMGASRPAHAIRPAGIAPPAVTSVPTAVWNNCGNKAMAAHGFDALAFGEVTVT